MSKNYSAGWKELSLEVLTPAQWNYKEDDEATMKKLVANIKKNQQIENIIVRPIDDSCEVYEVVNGNHRLEAMRTLGIKTATCFDLGIVSEAHAKRVAVETNETRFPINPVRLSEIVASLTQESGVDELLESMPFSKEQTEGMALLADIKGNKKKKQSTAEPFYYVLCEHCGQKHYTTHLGEPLQDDDAGEEPF